MSRLTSTIVCVSETERREGVAARTCDPARTVVILNGVDPQAAVIRTHEGVDRPRLVSVGRLKAPKDFPTLLEAVSRLAHQPLDLRVIGDGPDRAALEEMIQALGLDTRVQLVGDRDDVLALLGESDCFVLSSTSEGLPISILEAMAAGLPVVASDVGGVHELVAPDVTGLLVPARDPAALAQALGSLLVDASVRARLGAAARAAVEERFNVDRVRKEHLTLYESLLGMEAT
jgi:glycosyltransferase involved in cell wall biosynthesis